jgi:hypothetical protein
VIRLYDDANTTIRQCVAVGCGRNLFSSDELSLILAFRQRLDLSKRQMAQIVGPSCSDAFYFGWFYAGTHGCGLWAQRELDCILQSIFCGIERIMRWNGAQWQAVFRSVIPKTVNPPLLKSADIFDDLLPVGYAACASVGSFGAEGTT